jgi:hypothetical protein
MVANPNLPEAEFPEEILGRADSPKALLLDRRVIRKA